jgi:hypothetical protein
MVNGKWVVRDGALQTIELGWVLEKHNAIAKRMVEGE